MSFDLDAEDINQAVKLTQPTLERGVVSTVLACLLLQEWVFIGPLFFYRRVYIILTSYMAFYILYTIFF